MANEPFWWKLRPVARIAGLVILIGSIVLIARFVSFLIAAYHGHAPMRG